MTAAVHPGDWRSGFTFGHWIQCSRALWGDEESGDGQERTLDQPWPWADRVLQRIQKTKADKEQKARPRLPQLPIKGPWTLSAQKKKPIVALVPAPAPAPPKAPSPPPKVPPAPKDPEGLGPAGGTLGETTKKTFKVITISTKPQPLPPPAQQALPPKAPAEPPAPPPTAPVESEVPLSVLYRSPAKKRVPAAPQRKQRSSKAKRSAPKRSLATVPESPKTPPKAPPKAPATPKRLVRDPTIGDTPKVPATLSPPKKLVIKERVRAQKEVSVRLEDLTPEERAELDKAPTALELHPEPTLVHAAVPGLMSVGNFMIPNASPGITVMRSDSPRVLVEATTPLPTSGTRASERQCPNPLGSKVKGSPYPGAFPIYRFGFTFHHLSVRDVFTMSTANTADGIAAEIRKCLTPLFLFFLKPTHRGGSTEMSGKGEMFRAAELLSLLMALTTIGAAVVEEAQAWDVVALQEDHQLDLCGEHEHKYGKIQPSWYRLYEDAIVSAGVIVHRAALRVILTYLIFCGQPAVHAPFYLSVPHIMRVEPNPNAGSTGRKGMLILDMERLSNKTLRIGGAKLQLKTQPALMGVHKSSLLACLCPLGASGPLTCCVRCGQAAQCPGCLFIFRLHHTKERCHVLKETYEHCVRPQLRGGAFGCLTCGKIDKTKPPVWCMNCNCARYCDWNCLKVDRERHRHDECDETSQARQIGHRLNGDMASQCSTPTPLEVLPSPFKSCR
jgi:hypothetical protein